MLKDQFFLIIKSNRVLNALAAVVVCSLFFWHFIATVLFLIPTNPLFDGSANVFKRYISQYFYQNWHLFSPNPGIVEQKLWIRCKATNGAWSAWLDPTADLQERAYGNRFAAYGKLLYLHRSIPDGLIQTYSRMRKQKCGENTDCNFPAESISETPIYYTTVEYTANICSATQVHTSEIEFKIVRLFPFPFSKKSEMNSKPFYRAEELSFRPVQVVFSRERSA